MALALSGKDEVAAPNAWIGDLLAMAKGADQLFELLDAGVFARKIVRLFLKKGSQPFSVRSKRYRYSLGEKGGEELYDHQSDPWEWNNLAKNPEYTEVKQKLKAELLELTGR